MGPLTTWYALCFEGLPQVWNAVGDKDGADFLRAYAQGYLREEIRAEQVVRSCDPIHRFIEVAAQGSGKVLNYARFARDVGSGPKNTQAWYGREEDTLVGCTWMPSICQRAQVRQPPSSQGLVV